MSLKPDGSWERSDYDANGWLIRVVRPLTNQPPTASTNDCRVTEYSYDSVSGSPDSPTTQEGRPRTDWERVRSEVVSKTMYAYSGYDSYVRVAATARAGWSDAANENNKTTEDSEHRPTRSDSPDGTYVTYAHTDDSSGRLTVARFYDSDNVEFRSTEDQINTLGQPVSRKTYDKTSGSSVLAKARLLTCAAGRAMRCSTRP